MNFPISMIIGLLILGCGRGPDEKAIDLSDAKIVTIRNVEPPSMHTQLQGKAEEDFQLWTAKYGLKSSDAARIRDTIPYVKRVLPILTRRQKISFGNRNVDCQLTGTFPIYPEFTKAKLMSGRFLNEADESGQLKSCVLSKSVVDDLFGGRKLVGESVILRGYESSNVFHVVGVIQERRDSNKQTQTVNALDYPISGNIYIPLSTMNALYGSPETLGPNLSEIRVEFDSVESVLSSIPRLHETLRKRDPAPVYQIHSPLIRK